MQPDNAIIGSQDQDPFSLPQKPADDEAVDELRKKTRFSKSKEFKELRENMESRIDYYQKFLPGTAIPIASVDSVNIKDAWRVASIIIAELQAVIDGYEDAEKTLKEIEKQLDGQG